MSTTSTIDSTKLAKLIETEEAIFNDRHHKSREMTERARKSLAGRVASSWQATDPHPIYLAEGHGSKVVDVDGNEYVDFHNGYGAMAVGHAHPKIVAAVSDRVGRGTHFAQPTEESIVAAEHLQGRFGLPLSRKDTGYGHSSEQVDAVRAEPGLLLEYYDAVHRQTVEFLETLSDGDLDRIVDTRWDPPVTLGVRLVSTLADCLQHVGQAAYAKGLKPPKGR